MQEKKLINNLYKKFCDEINLFCKGNAKKHIIIGLSSGPDSSLLLDFFYEYQKENPLFISLSACHIHHGWGMIKKEWEDCANNAMEISIKKCNEYAIPIYIFKNQDKNNLKESGSYEAGGRKMRYDFFKKILKDHNGDAIALGHTNDDQIEGFFIKIIRGTSLSGLCGMNEIDDFLLKPFYILRPLLNIEKKDIIKALNEKKIEYIEDKSNSDEIALRNKIRLKLIPAIRSIDKRFDYNLNKTINNLKEANKSLNEYIKINLEKIYNKKTNFILIDELKKVDLYIQNEIILHFLFINNFDKNLISTSFINELIRFINNKENKTHKVNKFIFSKQKNIFKINYDL
jgi:tRNA(Ile)-lysidine synthase